MPDNEKPVARLRPKPEVSLRGAWLNAFVICCRVQWAMIDNLMENRIPVFNAEAGMSDVVRYSTPDTPRKVLLRAREAAEKFCTVVER